MMIVICAWCGKRLGEKPPLEDKSVTHGICAKCAKELNADDEQESDGRNCRGGQRHLS